jgi:hypothetical protein
MFNFGVLDAGVLRVLGFDLYFNFLGLFDSNLQKKVENTVHFCVKKCKKTLEV